MSMESNWPLMFTDNIRDILKLHEKIILTRAKTTDPNLFQIAHSISQELKKLNWEKPDYWDCFLKLKRQWMDATGEIF
jgi:hypothetical protein